MVYFKTSLYQSGSGITSQMDFVTRFPTTRNKKDAVWVIVDRLTKSAHFLPIKKGDGVDEIVKVYVNEIVRLHGVPASIV